MKSKKLLVLPLLITLVAACSDDEIEDIKNAVAFLTSANEMALFALPQTEDGDFALNRCQTFLESEDTRAVAIRNENYHSNHTILFASTPKYNLSNIFTSGNALAMTVEINLSNLPLVYFDSNNAKQEISGLMASHLMEYNAQSFRNSDFKTALEDIIESCNGSDKWWSFTSPLFEYASNNNNCHDASSNYAGEYGILGDSTQFNNGTAQACNTTHCVLCLSIR